MKLYKRPAININIAILSQTSISEAFNNDQVIIKKLVI